MQNHEARRIMLSQTIGYPVKWTSDLCRSFADAKVSSARKQIPWFCTLPITTPRIIAAFGATGARCHPYRRLHPSFVHQLSQ
jgi:hypothetical protein